MQMFEMPKPDNQYLASFVRQAPQMDISSRLHFFDLLFPYAEKLPANVFILNADSSLHLAFNQQVWQSFNFSSPHSIIDRSAKVMGNHMNWPEHIFETLRQNDLRVMNHGPEIHQERTLEGDFEKFWIARKEPILAENGQPLGVFGISVPIALKHTKIIWNEKLRQMILHMTPELSIRFTAREFEILQNILKGHSANEIAKQKNISPKTVETHVMNIKCKLDCTKQREIIPLLIKHDLAAAILEYRHITSLSQ